MAAIPVEAAKVKAPLLIHFAGIDDWERYVEYDKSLTRPAEVDTLLGDASKSERVLGFKPKVKFRELVKIMTEHELGKLGIYRTEDKHVCA